MLDRATWYIEPVEKKQEVIAKELRRILYIKKGVRFNNLERRVGKLRHAAIGITKGNLLMGSINRFMAIKPKKVFWDQCPEVRVALQDWMRLIRAAARDPTHVKELCARGAQLQGRPQHSRCVGNQRNVGTRHTGACTHRVEDSNQEMATKVLGFIVLKANVTLRWRHVGVCSNSTDTVS